MDDVPDGGEIGNGGVVDADTEDSSAAHECAPFPVFLLGIRVLRLAFVCYAESPPCRVNPPPPPPPPLSLFPQVLRSLMSSIDPSSLSHVTGLTAAAGILWSWALRSWGC